MPTNSKLEPYERLCIYCNNQTVENEKKKSYWNALCMMMKEMPYYYKYMQ